MTTDTPGQLELTLTFRQVFFGQRVQDREGTGSKITAWATFHWLCHYHRARIVAAARAELRQSSCHGRLAADQDKAITCSFAPALTRARGLGGKCFVLGRHDRLAAGLAARAGRRPPASHRPVPEATAAPYFQNIKKTKTRKGTKGCKPRE